MWRFIWRDVIASGEKLWLVGVVAALGMIALFSAAMWQVWFEIGPSRFDGNDWVVMPLVAFVVTILGAKVYGRLRLTLGCKPHGLRPHHHVAGLTWLQNRAVGFVYFLNGVGVLAAPFWMVWLIRQLG